MKVEIPFSEVKPGEKFTSLKTKRTFVGFKILEIIEIVLEIQAPLNAVMTYYDHRTELGPSSGAEIYVEPETIVEVERPTETEREGSNRLVLMLTDERMKEVGEMTKISKLPTKRDMINEALTLYELAQKGAQIGKEVALINEVKEVFEVCILKGLEAARPRPATGK